MFVYNLTVNIESDVEEDWKNWIKNDYIQKVLGSGYFSEVRMFRLIQDPKVEGNTYSIQFLTDSIQKIEQFLETEAPTLAAEHQLRYKNKHVAYRTVLQEEKL